VEFVRGDVTAVAVSKAACRMAVDTALAPRRGDVPLRELVDANRRQIV
jgi:hypothetical protein